jgi:two-component system response regulator
MSPPGGRIALVVESNPDVADVIYSALMIDKLAREVVVTPNGREALDYLLGRGVYRERDTTEMPCVILLDLALPGLDALQLLRELRAYERTKLLLIAVFSSSEERQEEVADIVYSLGVNSYLGKTPWSGSFAESLRLFARYWFALNEPPPTL